MTCAGSVFPQSNFCLLPHALPAGLRGRSLAMVSQLLSWSLPTYNHDVEVETCLHGFLAHLLNYGVNTDVAQQAGVDAHRFHWYNWFLSRLWDQFRHGCFVFALHWSCMGTKIEKSSLRCNNSLHADLAQELRAVLSSLFKGY